MKRSELKRKTPLARSSPDKIREWERRSRVPLKSTPSKRARPADPLADRCEATTPVCTGKAAEHRHHVAGRLGPEADEKWNTLDVTRACHDYIHAHPDESYRRGWMRSRLS